MKSLVSNVVVLAGSGVFFVPAVLLWISVVFFDVSVTVVSNVFVFLVALVFFGGVFFCG